MYFDDVGFCKTQIIRKSNYIPAFVVHACSPPASTSALPSVRGVLGRWGSADTHLKLVRSARSTFHKAELFELHGFSRAEPSWAPTTSPRPDRSVALSELNVVLKTPAVVAPTRRRPRRPDRKRISEDWRRSRAHASACTRRRGAQRRRQWLSFRTQQHGECPADRVWLLDRLANEASKNSCLMGTYIRRTLSVQPVFQGRARDIFPMRTLDGGDLKPAGWRQYWWTVFLVG